MASNAVKNNTAAGKKPAASKKSGASNAKKPQQTKSTARSTKGSGRASAVRELPEAEKQQGNPMILREAALWLILAVCILIFISYFGIGGYVGAVISDVSFGVFGVCAYLFPLLVFVAAAFLISNRSSSMAGLKFGASVLLYLCVCSFAALLSDSYDKMTDIAGLYEYSAAYKAGGGVIGGSICRLLCPALGAVGTGIVVGILAIICIVLITQKSLIRGVRSQSSRVYHSAKEASRRRREEREEDRRAWDEWIGVEQEQEGSCLDRAVEASDGLQPGEHAARPPQVERSMASSRRDGKHKSIPANRLPMSDEPSDRRAGRRRGSAARGELNRADGPQNRRTVRQDGQTAYGDGRQAQPSGQRARGTGGAAFVSPEIPRTDSTYPQGGEQRVLDVPVLFPAHSRVNHAPRVTGVTMDTEIPRDAATTAAETHEIAPSTAMRADAARYETAGRETYYINLDSDAEKGQSSADGPEVSGAGAPEAMELHIEGIDAPDHRKEERETETASTAKNGRAARRRIQTEAADDSFGAQTDMPFDVQEDTAFAMQEDPVSDLQEESSDETFAELSAPKLKEKRSSRQADSIWADEDDARSKAGSRGATSAGTVFSGSAGRKEPASEDASAEASAKDGTPSPKRNPRSSQQEIEEGIASVEAEMAKAAQAVKPEYVFPPIDLLHKGKNKSNAGQEQEIRQTAAKLQQTLNSFGVHVTVTNVSCGPSVTRYELQPEQGVKVSRIVSLADDIKLNLAAADIRIEAPIPGKAAVGIEVPNAENSAVALRDLIESDEFQKHPSKLAFATGKDIGGKVVVSDIAKMPHLLIAGATGSGKSVCINTLIMSILYKAHPDDVKLIMVDPKVVELSVYNGIPHLFIPVVTDPKKAAGALNWGVAEMTDRYNKFAEFGVRDLKGYNQKIEALADVDDENKPKKLPQIVIIVDELADLMMVAPGEVEDSICRLAQLARAAGIHLIIATQRPSVNVITGLIKANMPSRIAFSVSSGVDSRTIIDMNGAEKLLGKGDMLFYPQGYQKPARVQGAFVSDEEVADVVDFLKNKNMDASYNAEMEEQIAKVQQATASARAAEDTDALFADAGKFIIDKDKASIGMLQRVFKIGFNRAARIMDQLSDAGVVGPEEGTKPRKILMSAEQFENYLEENG